MSQKLGSVAYERDPGNFLASADRPYPVRERDYAEETAAAVDREVKETLELVDIDALIREMAKEGLRAV